MKKLPYWLKGGITALIVVFILVLLVSIIPDSLLSKCYLTGDVCDTTLIGKFSNSATNMIFAPQYLIVNHGGLDLFPSFFSIPLFVIFYFIIGAIIGLIYGKIKK